MPPEECGVPKIYVPTQGGLARGKCSPLASPWVSAYLENAPLLGPYPRSHHPLGYGWCGMTLWAFSHTTHLRTKEKRCGTHRCDTTIYPAKGGVLVSSSTNKQHSLQMGVSELGECLE